MTPEALLEQLKQKFGDAIAESEAKGVEVRLTVKPEAGWGVCRFLRDVGFEYLNCLSGADWMTHLEVVYDLSSLHHVNKVHLRVPVDRAHPVIRSVTDIWRAANWHERECYDLFGVHFDGHPDHRRILLPEDWVGFPLRKDYTDERLVPYTDYGMEEKLPRPEAEKGAPKAAGPVKPAAPPAPLAPPTPPATPPSTEPTTA
jgi:NADH-quinone oxidoreductase subunit C